MQLIAHPFISLFLNYIKTINILIYPYYSYSFIVIIYSFNLILCWIILTTKQPQSKWSCLLENGHLLIKLLFLQTFQEIIMKHLSLSDNSADLPLNLFNTFFSEFKIVSLIYLLLYSFIHFRNPYHLHRLLLRLLNLDS